MSVMPEDVRVHCAGIINYVMAGWLSVAAG